MEIRICKDRVALGRSAAAYVAEALRRIIAEKGEARIALSTGASQFDTLAHLIQEDVPWDKVEMFHLDEYVDLPETHPASFRKYLKEKFTTKVTLKAVHFVDGTEENRLALCQEISRAPIDIGLIGIGENAHIAFNDPPADFDTEEPYIVVNLNDTCKRQQVGEGWFATVDDVPKQAVSMSVKQIMKCREIVSCVPYAVKADAVKKTLAEPLSNMTPATMLKTHPAFTLYIDADSAAEAIAPIDWL
ncbi:MAG: glucosamine-6-phosphate deaminase [Ruminococcaceae bacterium]|nr:glucosamine-6-phosphate deaminase [Oscillospiraceae bacterium]